MRKTKAYIGLLLLTCGAASGILLMTQLSCGTSAQSKTEEQAKKAAADIAALQAEVARLKDRAPNQPHPMEAVAFNFSNLWFAGQKKNWTLARYFFNESRNRALWAIRIDPTPKGTNGERVDLKGIFDGIDNGVLSGLKQAIEKKDSAQFVATYKQALEACYACHKALGRLYLRPMIPTTPPQTIISFDPDAKWPE